MFKENKAYNQLNIFSIHNSLSKKQSKLWNNSREHRFYSHIFCNIDETNFKVLYSTKFSRPNVPINQMVGALILKHLKNWTYNELFQNLNFNLLTRHAIGINSLDEDIFAEASIFNFQNRLIDHFIETKEDLLDSVFCQLTRDQIHEFEVDTSVQRGDSFLVGSNIVDYTRLRLLIEVVRRIARILTEEHRCILINILQPYLSHTSTNYVYHVQREELDNEYTLLAEVYQRIIQVIGEQYKDEQAYQNFIKVANQHFHKKKGSFTFKPNEELHSGILMSPDDIDATYRKKNPQTSKGYVTHISETVNPDNTVDLITDVITKPNNIGDAEILESRLPVMIERTPDLKEYFVDGQYGSPGVDKVAKRKVKIYQKAIRGRKDGTKLNIEEDSQGKYWVSCEGGQRVQSSITSKSKDGTYNRKAHFNNSQCLKCPLKSKCKLKVSTGNKNRGGRTYYFNRTKIEIHRRHQNFAEVEEHKKYSRANVEATVKEVKRGMKNGKVRIRGWIRISFHMTLTSVAINFTRIYRQIDKNLQNIINYYHDTSERLRQKIMMTPVI